ncbi:aldose epimerase family protein [Dinghuibacter silviterrae]|uniref:Aldose 1-epimerase n=1 Tax=Dinghuibacter silviterrae TaxID=1539049 RepID=A0A4V3GKT3_9BACT|nr:aldose epimerase family protein [Dinghuibacter silviterrae]TDW96872.1 aldose 1-epimerase [Dinghuibacter silviterrae]
MLTITESVCHTPDAQYLFTLQNPRMHLTLTNLGASIRTLWVPDRNGRLGNVVAGYQDIDTYAHNPLYLGCVVGRYVNRIWRGRFVLDGVTYHLTQNEGTNHLHGGFRGFHQQLWEVLEVVQSTDKASVLMGYRSKDGEEGYPGNLDATIRYTLRPDNRLYLDYTARSDKRTPVNLSNHSYFNLSAFARPLIDEHELRVFARDYAEKNGNNLPTGMVRPVAGTPLDFSRPARLGERLGVFPVDRGLDHNFVLDHVAPGRSANGAPGEPGLAAALRDPASGRRLRVYTDKPCIQVYTANWWDGSFLGAQGVTYEQHGAVALETQFYPDSPNQPGFPSTILDPGAEYKTTTIFEFDVHDPV